MTWLDRVRLMVSQQGLSVRAVASRAGISHTHVSNILAGRSLPSLEMLYMLLDALTTSETVKAEILKLFTSENPSYLRHTTQKDKTNAQVSKADIHKLTDAIIELSGLLREFLQEQRRYPE